MEATGQRLCRYRDEDAMLSLYAIADIHRGARGCSLSILGDDIARIYADPLAAWVLLGDYADFIAPTDKRFDPSSISEDVRACDMGTLAKLLIDATAEDFATIQDRCLGAGYGNHEWRYFTDTAAQLAHRGLCEILDTPDLRYSGWFDIYFEHAPRLKKAAEWVTWPQPGQCGRKGQVRLRVFAHHGFGGAQTAGGKINALHKLLTQVDADLVLMGHLHEQMLRTRAVMGVDSECKSVHQRCQVGLITGSYLRIQESGGTSYGEMRGYAPSVLGAARATFRPSTMELTAENRVISGVMV